MSFSVFATLTLLLLLTPGPTNTLIALTCAQQGFARCAPLVAAELFAYLAFVGLFVAVLGPVAAHQPSVLTACQTVAAMWVLYLAAKLWRAPAASAHHAAPIGWRTIFVTTALNPKGLIVASMLLHVGKAGQPQSLGFLIFGLDILAAALVWGGLASTVLPAMNRRWPRLMTRMASVVLLGFFGNLLLNMRP